MGIPFEMGIASDMDIPFDIDMVKNTCPVVDMGTTLDVDMTINIGIPRDTGILTNTGIVKDPAQALMGEVIFFLYETSHIALFDIAETSCSDYSAIFPNEILFSHFPPP
jgi:hypothetical protein